MRWVRSAKRESHLRLGFAEARVPYQRAKDEGRSNDLYIKGQSGFPVAENHRIWTGS
jgi:hypothetical protein